MSLVRHDIALVSTCQYCDTNVNLMGTWTADPPPYGRRLTPNHRGVCQHHEA